MPPFKEIHGSIREKHRNNTEISLTWEIPNIFKETKEGYQMVSAPINWLETSWRLLFYPNGVQGLAPGWLDLYLTSSTVPKNAVRVTFGFQKPDQTEYLVLQDQKFGTQGRLYHNIRFMKKTDFEKHIASKTRKGPQLPYTSIIIICIIRIENSSCVVEKSIPSTNLGETGEIKITTRKATERRLSIEWTISQPFTLGHVQGDYYSSPEFEFLNTKWQMRIYPFGHPVKESKCWVGVDVWKLDLGSCKKPVLLTLGIKDTTREEAKSYVNETLAEYRRLWSGYRIARRAKLKKNFEEVLTIKCTLQPDELPSTSAAADACVEEMAPPAIEMAEGIIETNRTTSELSFEWRIREFSSKMSAVGDRHTSPIIEFLNMSWTLKIYPRGRNPTEPVGWMALEVWKLDWTSAARLVYVSVGIKKTDSMKEVIYRNQKLPGHRRLWRTAKFMQLSELHRRKFYIAFADVFTITCTLRSQEACLSTIPLRPVGETDGIVRERVCNCHKEVEWDTILSWQEKTSPTFSIGSQTYWMTWGNDYDSRIQLNLYSVGPPIGLPKPTIFWAGLKRMDGKLLFVNTSGFLNMTPFRNRYVQRNLFLVRGAEITIEQKCTDVTLFLRFEKERPSKSEEKCSHPVVTMVSSPKGSGIVQYMPCERHVQAEWLLSKSVSCEFSSDRWQNPSIYSPEISCLDEQFKFEWRKVINSNTLDIEAYVLNAYSRRLSTCGPYREGHWWAALRRPDGRYDLTNIRGSLDAENECNMWTIRGSLALNFLDCQEDNLGVVLRYTVDDPPKDPDFSCVHSEC